MQVSCRALEPRVAGDPRVVGTALPAPGAVICHLGANVKARLGGLAMSSWWKLS